MLDRAEFELEGARKRVEDVHLHDFFFRNSHLFDAANSKIEAFFIHDFLCFSAIFLKLKSASKNPCLNVTKIRAKLLYKVT